jgi:hypothetical protein
LHVAFKDGLAIDKEHSSGVAADVSALDREDLGPSGIMHRLAIHHGLAKHEYVRHVKGARPKLMRTLGVQTCELKETLDTTVLALEGKRALKFLAEQVRSLSSFRSAGRHPRRRAPCRRRRSRVVRAAWLKLKRRRRRRRRRGARERTSAAPQRRVAHTPPRSPSLACALLSLPPSAPPLRPPRPPAVARGA